MRTKISIATLVAQYSLTVADVASMLYVDSGTVRRWLSGQSRAPYAAVELLRIRAPDFQRARNSADTEGGL